MRRSSAVQSIPFGPFTFEEQLGTGGFGTVYRAFDRRFKTHVALKRVRDEWKSNAAVAAQFETSVAISRKVNHSHVCRVFDHGVIDGIPYLTMPIYAGGSLRNPGTQATCGPLPPLVHGLARTMHEVHRQKVIHLDSETGKHPLHPGRAGDHRRFRLRHPSGSDRSRAVTREHGYRDPGLHGAGTAGVCRRVQHRSRPHLRHLGAGSHPVRTAREAAAVHGKTMLDQASAILGDPLETALPVQPQGATRTRRRLPQSAEEEHHRARFKSMDALAAGRGSGL